MGTRRSIPGPRWPCSLRWPRWAWSPQLTCSTILSGALMAIAMAALMRYAANNFDLGPAWRIVIAVLCASARCSAFGIDWVTSPWRRPRSASWRLSGATADRHGSRAVRVGPRCGARRGVCPEASPRLLGRDWDVAAAGTGRALRSFCGLVLWSPASLR